MGFFKKDTKEEESKAVDSQEVATKNTSNEKEVTSKDATATAEVKASNILIHPWITEKTHGMLDSNQYVFKIANKTSKKQVKNAVKELYGFRAEGISIVSIKAKKRFFGKKMGKKPGFKKAIVTLKKGDKIELFQGV